MLVNHRTACFGKMLLLILILQISHASSGTFTESFVLSVIATIASLSMEPSPETALVASASVSLIPLWRDYGYPYFFPTPLEKAINKFKQQKFLIDKDNHELWFLLKPWKDLYKSDAAKKIPIKKMIEGAVHIFSGEIEEHRGKKGLSNA
ncbi:MAG: hypothetical protein OXE99_01250, partial [Cellvibrionales bacterium]|nr:hypothetical protein [Cellvibrionales bacterium]